MIYVKSDGVVKKIFTPSIRSLEVCDFLLNYFPVYIYQSLDLYRVNNMDFIKIAKVNDFQDEHIKSYSIMGKKIGVVRKEDGEFFAIEVGCKHQGADLTAGLIDGLMVTCPRHQWKYDLSTGKCLNHESPLLRRHALKIKNDAIFISLHPID